MTQADDIAEMGSYAGKIAVPRVDIDFIYRVFIWINPSDAFRVDRLAIELCDSRGANLFDDEEEQGEI